MAYRDIEIRELPAECRPREKLFTQGVRNLSDRELLSIILGKGIKGKGVYALSDEVLSRLDTINYRIDETMLLEIPGLGKA